MSINCVDSQQESPEQGEPLPIRASMSTEWRTRVIIACDGNCRYAHGRKRPLTECFSKDENDWAYRSDGEVGIAPDIGSSTPKFERSEDEEPHTRDCFPHCERSLAFSQDCLPKDQGWETVFENDAGKHSGNNIVLNEIPSSLPIADFRRRLYNMPELHGDSVSE